jgi:dipicolinate synthase subunit A
MKPRVRIAVLGGDRREPEIARLAAADDFDVRVFGAPADTALPGALRVESAADAMRGADVIVLPVPHMTNDLVFAPHAAAPIKLDGDLLGLALSGAVLITGAANQMLRESAARRGIAVFEYGEDDGLKSMRGPLIAEAALEALDEAGRGPAPGSIAVVVGLGAIGAPLVRLLAGHGVQVLAVTRNPSAVPSGLAGAAAAVIAFTDLQNHVSGASHFIATTGGRAVGADVLAALRPDAVIADVASPPGSFDCAGDPSLSARVLWLRALGGRHPARLAAAQWQVIRARLVECGIIAA